MITMLGQSKIFGETEKRATEDSISLQQTMGVLEDIRTTTKALKLSFESIQSSSSQSNLSNFYSHCYSFISLVDKLNNIVEKDLEIKNHSLKELEIAINAQRNQPLNQRELQVIQREANCARREWKVEETEKKVAIMAKKWIIRPPRKYVPKTHTPIKLKLRDGVSLSTSKELLLQFKDSKFVQLIADNDHRVSFTGELHLDQPAQPFTLMHGYMYRISMNNE